MDKTSYLIISNVVTGVALIVTCIISCCRRRNIACPFCNERVDTHELRTHIGLCTQHNTLYMGRYSPTIQPLAVAVPLPPTFALQSSYIQPAAPIHHHPQQFVVVDL